jgi:uncharacterized protein (DUF608 family)
MSNSVLGRREFLRRALQAGGAAGLAEVASTTEGQTAESRASPTSQAPTESLRAFNGIYQGVNLAQIAFPMGGMGAGMICLEGAGGLSKFWLRHDRPTLELQVFAAVAIKGSQPAARILEGPVPEWKLRPQFPGPDGTGCWGLPRFHNATFQAAFPFASVRLADDQLPLAATITGWSPFSPGDADSASLPVAGLEYRFENQSRSNVEAVFSFNAENFLATASDSDSERLDRIQPTPGGFILYGAGTKERPWDEGSCAAWIDDPQAEISYTWPLDSLAVLWKQFASGDFQARAPLHNKSASGASIFVPLMLAPGESKTIKVRLAWYVGNSNLYEPEKGYLDGKVVAYPQPAERYRPWYAGRFPGIDALVRYWHDNYAMLWQSSQVFSKAFHDCTLPPEVIEATSANLSILKSPTVLRQTDGRLWGWEGTFLESPEINRSGISGTSTHVWNYAQSVAHLFPQLERRLRETELGENQNEEGLQYSRTPLPIRPVEPGHTIPDGPAADGQLGGIIKVYREWRISGDAAWLRRVWPKARTSLDYCIRTWDPQHKGWLEEPHLTTYDMEFWGADSFCASLYLGALKAATLISAALHETADPYADLLRKCQARIETELFNGEYFVQNTQWRNLQTPFPPKTGSWPKLLHLESPEQMEIAQKEGPAGQYGTGCLSDGVMGEWLCLMSGIGAVLERRKVESHLLAVHRYNLKKDLTDHANFARAAFACGSDSGLLVCSWPRGRRPSLPLYYSDEVWSGVEYQVASHLIALGNIDAGLDIVRATRRRYDGRVRNPFAEVEAGHWYARAMSSYALLQACSGARFDAVDQVLHLRPAIRGDFRCFLSTATGFGTVGVKNGKAFLDVISGHIPYREIQYTET